MKKTNTTLLVLFLKNLSPAFLRILLTLWSYEKQRRLKNYSGVFPSREKIAEQSKCSVDRVKQFNQMCNKFGSTFVEIKKRFNPSTKRYSSNVYLINKDLFEIVTILDGLGYLKKWDKIKHDVYTQVSENEWFLYERWATYRHPITQGKAAKLPDNEESLKKETLRKVPKEGSPSCLIFNMGLSSETLHIADYYCTKKTVLEARNDFHWFLKMGNTVKSRDGLMIALLKKQSLRQNAWLEKELSLKKRE